MHASDGQRNNKKKILVVDDAPVVQRLLRRFLDNLGFEVTIATDSESCIAEYKIALESNNRFFAVIIDLNLDAGLDGLETTEKLRELDPEVRAIISSGYSNHSILVDYPQYGFSGALPKPFTIDELSRVLI